MMDVFQVNRLLKQRPPFQMVERITALEPGVSAQGIKTVSINDPWFAGHFPELPILPGVLVVEACAQVCAVTAQAGAPDEGQLYVLLKVDQFKFLKPILPGDTMEINIRQKSKGGPLFAFEATVNVGGICHAKGQLSFTAVTEETITGSEKEAEA